MLNLFVLKCSLDVTQVEWTLKNWLHSKYLVRGKRVVANSCIDAVVNSFIDFQPPLFVRNQ